MASGKKYGLIAPEKSKQPSFQASRNVFGDDSDSENDTSKKKSSVLLRPSHNIIRQAKISQEKAVLEDPTVYQYDEIYDSMSSQKEEKKSKSKGEKKPRYIENLLKTANKRKIENERRMERKIQKEREQEGEEFADKEVFVTAAYKKKLEEMKIEEEKEKREEYLESIGDVTKQKDLDGFYRHLYEQKLGSDKVKGDKNKEITDNKKDGKNLESLKQPSKQKSDDKIESKRNYRKRKSSSDKNNLSEGEIEDSDEEINRLSLKDIKAKKSKQKEENIDADSDFSIDDSSSDDDTSKKDKGKPKDSTKELFKPPLPSSKDSSNTKLSEVHEEKDKKVSDKENSPITPPLEPKTKVDIWKKRTVGDILDQAIRRYYERKAARGS